MIGSITNLESDLFDQFDRLQRQFNDLWRPYRGPASIRAVAPGSVPAINIGSSPDGVDVYVFAAGLDRDSIDISIQMQLLTIGAKTADNPPEQGNAHLKERSTGAFKRTLTLPDDIDPDSATANYRNGVLHLSFKRRAEAKPRKIQVA